VLCPELVGRDREQALLRARVEDLAERRGGVVVLMGEAGAGKSRLAKQAVDAAAERGLPVLAGRAVPGGSPSPYRPLMDAFLGAFRSTTPPDDPALAGFHGHLGRLVPAWRPASPGAEESPMLLGEAVARLLAVHGRERGSVLLLEDVHWADAETLEVLDHLADALRSEPVLCVCTSRPDGAARDLIGRLERRDPAAIVRVTPLGDAGVDRMLAACLDDASPPAHLSTFVRTHSDGSPFLVEELLAGLVASDELRFDDGHWISAGHLTPTVPASLRESIHRRLGSLTPTARRVLGAAALLGRSFDWELLPGIAEVDGRDAVDALRAAVEEQLIEVDGTGFTFRHALTREAVLHDLLPPERRELATRAWPAHERANPGLPGPTLELAADLAEAAGEPVAAARHLVESARRALVSGALTTAEATARRAVRLAGNDDDVSFDAAEVLVHVLAAAGKAAEALSLGRQLDAPAASAGRQADLRVAIARAALAAGDVAGAAADVAAARAAAGAAPDPALVARLDAVAASVALDQADLEAADRLARSAVEGAAATDQPAVECEALLVVGRVTRAIQGIEPALVWHERAAAVAAGAGLAQLHLRAQQEQALIVWTRGDVQPLHDVRDLAVRYGALITVAVMDLSLADIALSTYDKKSCLDSARACVEASRRYGLATESVAHLWLAGAHALHGDHGSMDAAIASALAPDPDDPRILADLYGRVLTTSAFVDDELDRLPGLVDTMMEHVRVAPPTTSVYPGRILWALLHTADDEDLGAEARAEFTEAAERVGLALYLGLRDVIEAVALGRQDEADGAMALFEPAYDRLRARPLGAGAVHSYALVTARAALRDGWGDPVRWLREAEAFFAASGYERLARRCRTMLGEAGAPVPRRGRGDSEVPPSLRALGVTSREVDVLKLVTAGRSNKQIAEELFLSPKTVERHLSSLFSRLAVGNRRELADRARTHLGATSP
jgi:DNA-binding CsgD family transcriptional regulator